MAPATQETQTMNTPQPYGGTDLAGHSGSKPDVDATGSQVSSTRGVGAGAGGTSMSGLASDRIESRDRVNGVQGGRKDTNGKVEPAEEEGGAARGTGTGAAEGENAHSNGSSAEPEGGYPEQLHAGKLDGPGPEYGRIHRVVSVQSRYDFPVFNHLSSKQTMGDRIQGVKEEIKGSIKRDPGLKKTGKERMTGELKRKQVEEVRCFRCLHRAKLLLVTLQDRNTDPFQNADEDKKGDDESDTKKTRTEKTDESGLVEHPQARPTQKGRDSEEQATGVHS